MHLPTERVIKVLELAVADREGKRLSDFSSMLSIPKGTLSPILAELCLHGLLYKKGEKYFGGTALFSLGYSAAGNMRTREFAKAELSELVTRFGETCYFGVLEGGKVLYVEKADSPNPLRMLTGIGHKLPAYATGVGKALLMSKSHSELRALYPEGLKPLTKKTVTDFEQLEKELSEARERGYSSECEESTEYIRCFGAPIVKDGATLGAISIAVPTFRYREEMREEYTSALLASAERLSRLFAPDDPIFYGAKKDGSLRS